MTCLVKSCFAFWLQELQGQPQIVSAITSCVSEDGAEIKDSASDQVRQSRGKLRAVENRLKALLKGQSGEVSEMVSLHSFWSWDVLLSVFVSTVRATLI